MSPPSFPGDAPACHESVYKLHGRRRRQPYVRGTSMAMERLKALSVRQPWIELILSGRKTDELRSMSTAVRGRVYLYASKQRYDEAFERELAQTYDLSGFDALPRGWIVGTVEIVGCRWDAEESIWRWPLKNPRRLRTPLLPLTKPQPRFFHPFGRPEDDATFKET